MSHSFSRRSLLKAAAGLTGAAIGTRLAGSSFIGTARAAEKSALLVLFFEGGYNQMFSSTDTVVGRFGVTDAEVMPVGNGLAIHGPTLGQLPTFATQHMATIGCTVGSFEHAEAISRHCVNGGKPWVSQLAAAMGGDAAIKAAAVGEAYGMHQQPPVDGVSVQFITDIDPLVKNLGGGAPDPLIPDRAIAGPALGRVQTMSASIVDANPRSLLTLREGYTSAGALLRKPPKPVSFEEIASAYGIGTRRTFAYPAHLDMIGAAAELLIRTGTNVVFANVAGDQDGSVWDSHGAPNGDGRMERYLYSLQVRDGLKTFCDRMVNDPDYNVVVAMIGDFARTGGYDDGTGHADTLAATVIGKYVKTGTTGRMALGTESFTGGGGGSIQQMWSYFAEVLKVRNPFGANPHPLVL
jgi:hypothetical protein